METTALKAAISYESKLVRRNWLFYFFIFGVLGILSVFVPWTRDWIFWENVAFASSIPIRGIYFLNLFQSLIVILLFVILKGSEEKLKPGTSFPHDLSATGNLCSGSFWAFLSRF